MNKTALKFYSEYKKIISFLLTFINYNIRKLFFQQIFTFFLFFLFFFIFLALLKQKTHFEQLPIKSRLKNKSKSVKKQLKNWCTIFNFIKKGQILPYFLKIFFFFCIKNDF